MPPAITNRKCSKCGSLTTTTYHKDGYLCNLWRKDKKGKHLCDNCWTRLIGYPERRKYYKEIANPRIHAKWSKHRINVKGIERYYDMRINRKGFCTWCRRSVKAGDFKRTNYHHLEYRKDPLEAMVEICVRCHVRFNSGLLVPIPFMHKRLVIH